MTKNQIHLITTTPELEQVCKAMWNAAFVAIDTEFMRERTYYAQLCLIQIATPEYSAIIDPLAPGIDLAPFYQLLNQAPAVKVFHAARQDVEIFYYATGQAPQPLFDTQVAAMVCGFGESTGYQTLVQKYCRKSLDKSARFTDWSKRPLSERHLLYALDDVIYLCKVYQGLLLDLESNQRLDWLDEEMALLGRNETYAMPPDDAWHRIKHRSRDPRFLGLLKAVTAWREREAVHRDLPRGRVLKDEVLLEIASHPPRDAEALANIRGLSPKFAQGSQGQGLLAAIAAAQPLPAGEMPAQERPHGAPVKNALVGDLLKLLLKIRCKEAGVAPKLIASADDIERLATEDQPDIPALSGWRYEMFGADALKVKAGELGFLADGNDVRLIRDYSK